MALSPEDLDQVGTYVKSHLPEWLPTNVIDLSERITRVEEELKSQRELMLTGFANVDRRFEELQHNTDKRFEGMNKRFESLQHNMDKRFEAVNARMRGSQWLITTGFGVIGLLVVLFEFMA